MRQLLQPAQLSLSSRDQRPSRFSTRSRLLSTFLTAFFTAPHRVRLITRSGYDWTGATPGSSRPRARTGSSSSSSMARPPSSASTAFRSSARCIRVGTTMKCSSMPSMCWRWTGEDPRELPLSMRKASLARLRGRPDGMFLAPFEQGEIGPGLIRQACKLVSRVWSRNASIDVVAAAGHRTGSRSRTRLRRRHIAPRRRSEPENTTRSPRLAFAPRRCSDRCPMMRSRSSCAARTKMILDEVRLSMPLTTILKPQSEGLVDIANAAGPCIASYRTDWNAVGSRQLDHGGSRS
jgi:hypothetical protein